MKHELEDKSRLKKTSQEAGVDICHFYEPLKALVRFRDPLI